MLTRNATLMYSKAEFLPQDKRAVKQIYMVVYIKKLHLEINVFLKKILFFSSRRIDKLS